jgi:hypothetical protein
MESEKSTMRFLLSGFALTNPKTKMFGLS